MRLECMMSEQWKGMRGGTVEYQGRKIWVGLSQREGHGLALLVHDDTKKQMDIQLVSLLSSWLLCSSVGKEAACNAGDPGLIPGLGGSPGEGNGNPFQYSCLENPMDKGAWRATVHGVARVGHDLVTKPPPPLLSYLQTISPLLLAPDRVGMEGGGTGLSSCHHSQVHINITLDKLLLT